MAAPAIDFSAATRQISESMNNAMSHLTETVQMDMNMLEKRRIEMMNEMELTQLNSFFQGRNEEATLEAVEQFEDRWVEKMADKNGRLSGRDMVEMRREKQVVEGIIQRNNAALEQIGVAQSALRSPQGSVYDGEYARKALQEYAETGKFPSTDQSGVSPENPFLRIRPVEPESFLRSQRRPQKLGEERRQISTDSGLYFQTTTTYATDEDRAAYIIEQMRANPQFQLGIEERYFELSPSERMEVQQDAVAKEMNPIDYYALSFSENLWRDEVKTSVDVPSARREQYPPTSRSTDTTIDYSSRPAQELIYHGRTMRGYDLLPVGRRISRTLIDARNLETGEIESPGGVQGVLAGYSPETNKIIVRARISDYEKPVTEEGEQVYRAVIKSTGRSPVQGTKAEIEAEIAEREAEHGVKYGDITPVTEKVKDADVYYELDADKYSDLLEGIRLPQGQQKKTQGTQQDQKRSTGIEW